MPISVYIFWVVFNLCFLAFTTFVLLKVMFVEKRTRQLEENVSMLERKIDIVCDQIGLSIDNEECHYDSLCHHIQNNREIELDIYEEVRRK